MTRPIYETARDRAEARAVARRVASLWGLGVREHPQLDAADFTFTEHDRPHLLVEVKVRTNPFAKYPDYMLALRKWREIVERMRLLSVNGILMVKFTDCVAWTFFTPEPFLVRDGGRYDRGDRLDQEPMAYTPMERFCKVRGI